jgi:hypothetical protein
VKVIYRELFRSKSDEQLFDKEVRMLRLLHHPHVIQYVILIVVFFDLNHIRVLAIHAMALFVTVHDQVPGRVPV